MDDPTSLSAVAAAQKVLQDAGTPLHYQEITNRVLAARLWKSEGKTPSATINSQLTVSINKKGPASPFRRTGPGIFALNTDRAEQDPQLPQTAPKEDIPAKRTPGSHALVLGYIERIAKSAFSDFPRPITDLAHGKHGVYALYKDDHLYYVGLATNLRNRIKHHLSDKHAEKWNRFSLFLVRHVEHIRELESIILRIADPKGNTAGGRLPGAENLCGQLQKAIREEHQRQTQTLFGTTRKSKSGRPKKPRRVQGTTTQTTTRQPTLAPYKDRGITTLRATHKKQPLTATVNPDGTITFAGKTYTSPSVAGAAAVKRDTCNGWTFWEYERTPGDWVKLDTLRK